MLFFQVTLIGIFFVANIAGPGNDAWYPFFVYPP